MEENNQEVNYIQNIGELEKLRKRVITLNIIIYLIIAIIIIVCLFYLHITTLMPYFLIAIVGTFAKIIITLNPKNKFELAYKKLIVLDVFKKTFENVTYKPDEGISERTIRKLNMISSGNLYHSNDYISATYKDINFESADVWIEEKTVDSDGHTHRTTYFKGQWYIFDFNKIFKSNIQVCERSFYNNVTNKMHKIELEDMEFNKEFKVYAKDDIEAFYILSPVIMQRIKLLNDNVNGKLIFCFVDNKLHIGVHNHRDFYETSVYKKIDVEKAEGKILNEINDIIHFIEDLKLDNDLFRKEV